jgi:outer membrane protein assembly factor BamD (BamD/ComL family)
LHKEQQMKRLMVLGLVLIALLGGCSSDKSNELLETARFEEKQNNNEHARKLYQEIVEKYPESPAAKQAQERLNALQGK